MMAEVTQARVFWADREGCTLRSVSGWESKREGGPVDVWIVITEKETCGR